MSVFPLLYKVFYDKKAVSETVENEKGRCGKVLFALAFVVSLLVCFRLYAVLGEPAEKVLTQIAGQLPRLVFENGEIREPDNFVSRLIPETKDIFFVLDTTEAGQTPVLDDLPPNGFYVTKSEIVLKKGKKVNVVPFKDLKIVDMTVEQQDLGDFFIRFLQALKKAVVFISFFVILPLMFLQYVLFSYLVSWLSFILSSVMKTEMDYDKRIRLSALALIPAVMLNEIAPFFGVSFRLNWWQGIALTTIYLYCFMKENAFSKAQDV